MIEGMCGSRGRGERTWRGWIRYRKARGKEVDLNLGEVREGIERRVESGKEERGMDEVSEKGEGWIEYVRVEGKG